MIVVQECEKMVVCRSKMMDILLLLLFLLLFLLLLFVFFFNDTATTEIYTLSLHDALPICI